MSGWRTFADRRRPAEPGLPKLKVLALRAVPLLRGGVGLATVFGVLFIGAVLDIVARPLAR